MNHARVRPQDAPRRLWRFIPGAALLRRARDLDFLSVQDTKNTFLHPEVQVYNSGRFSGRSLKMRDERGDCKSRGVHVRRLGENVGDGEFRHVFGASSQRPRRYRRELNRR